jgi:hypothetical protein
MNRPDDPACPKINHNSAFLQGKMQRVAIHLPKLRAT